MDLDTAVRAVLADLRLLNRNDPAATPPIVARNQLSLRHTHRLANVWTDPDRVHIVADRIQSIWHHAVCAHRSMRRPFVMDLTQRDWAEQSIGPLVRRINRCMTNGLQRMIVLLVWHWNDPIADQAFAAHLTLLYLNAELGILRYFDPTDGRFVWGTRDRPRAGNRHRIVNSVLAAKIQRYNGRIVPFTDVDQRAMTTLQAALERDMQPGDAEQRMVQGYCVPLVMLCMVLALRLRRFNFGGIARALHAVLERVRDRAAFRRGLLLWQQRLARTAPPAGFAVRPLRAQSVAAAVETHRDLAREVVHLHDVVVHAAGILHPSAVAHVCAVRATQQTLAAGFQ